MVAGGASHRNMSLHNKYGPPRQGRWNSGGPPGRKKRKMLRLVIRWLAPPATVRRPCRSSLRGSGAAALAGASGFALVWDVLSMACRWPAEWHGHLAR